MFPVPRVTARHAAGLSAYVGGRPADPPTQFLNGGRPYGYGKAALADSLRGLDVPAGASVLLPALVPHRLPEPIRAVGLEPRFYRVRSDLRPDVDDLLDRIDDTTAVIVGVQYFGFPQQAWETLRDVADDEGLVLVDDSSHGALSERDGQPFGAHGDVGFSSLHKLLPVPNGAILYGGAELDTPERSVASSFTPVDSLYVVRAAIRAVEDRSPGSGRLLGAPLSAATIASRLLRRGESGDRGDPGWDVPMSRLALAYLSRMDRTRVVSRRRSRYREWLDVLGGVDSVEPVFERLPPGVCPWKCPVVCSDPIRFLGTVSGNVAGALTWPMLPDAVSPREYPTATRLSRTLMALPVHQSIPERRIQSLTTKFDDWE